MKVFIEKERCDHVRIANDTGADLEQYEFGVVGPISPLLRMKSSECRTLR